jgi:hypothetical protein
MLHSPVREINRASKTSAMVIGLDSPGEHRLGAAMIA